MANEYELVLPEGASDDDAPEPAQRKLSAKGPRPTTGSLTPSGKGGKRGADKDDTTSSEKKVKRAPSAKASIGASPAAGSRKKALSEQTAAKQIKSVRVGIQRVEPALYDEFDFLYCDGVPGWFDGNKFRTSCFVENIVWPEHWTPADECGEMTRTRNLMYNLVTSDGKSAKIPLCLVSPLQMGRLFMEKDKVAAPTSTRQQLVPAEWDQSETGVNSKAHKAWLKLLEDIMLREQEEYTKNAPVLIESEFDEDEKAEVLKTVSMQGARQQPLVQVYNGRKSLWCRAWSGRDVDYIQDGRMTLTPEGACALVERGGTFKIRTMFTITRQFCSASTRDGGVHGLNIALRMVNLVSLGRVDPVTGEHFTSRSADVFKD